MYDKNHDFFYSQGDEEILSPGLKRCMSINYIKKNYQLNKKFIHYKNIPKRSIFLGGDSVSAILAVLWALGFLKRVDFKNFEQYNLFYNQNQPAYFFEDYIGKQRNSMIITNIMLEKDDLNVIINREISSDLFASRQSRTKRYAGVHKDDKAKAIVPAVQPSPASATSPSDSSTAGPSGSSRQGEPPVKQKKAVTKRLRQKKPEVTVEPGQAVQPSEVVKSATTPSTEQGNLSDNGSEKSVSSLTSGGSAAHEENRTAQKTPTEVSSEFEVKIQRRARTDSVETYLQALFHKMTGDVTCLKKVYASYKAYQKYKITHQVFYKELYEAHEKLKFALKNDIKKDILTLQQDLSQKHESFITSTDLLTRLRNRFEIDVKIGNAVGNYIAALAGKDISLSLREIDDIRKDATRRVKDAEKAALKAKTDQAVTVEQAFETFSLEDNTPSISEKKLSEFLKKTLKGEFDVFLNDDALEGNIDQYSINNLINLDMLTAEPENFDEVFETEDSDLRSTVESELNAELSIIKPQNIKDVLFQAKKDWGSNPTDPTQDYVNWERGEKIQKGGDTGFLTGVINHTIRDDIFKRVISQSSEICQADKEAHECFDKMTNSDRKNFAMALIKTYDIKQLVKQKPEENVATFLKNYEIGKHVMDFTGTLPATDLLPEKQVTIEEATRIFLSASKNFRETFVVDPNDPTIIMTVPYQPYFISDDIIQQLLKLGWIQSEADIPAEYRTPGLEPPNVHHVVLASQGGGDTRKNARCYSIQDHGLIHAMLDLQRVYKDGVSSLPANTRPVGRIFRQL